MNIKNDDDSKNNFNYDDDNNNMTYKNLKFLIKNFVLKINSFLLSLLHNS